MCVELAITWPKPLSDLKMLHRKSQQVKKSDRIELLNLRLIGFEHHLKYHWLSSSGKVESMAGIFLPCQVQTHLSEKINLVWGDSSKRVLYLELSGKEELYGFSNKNK